MNYERLKETINAFLYWKEVAEERESEAIVANNRLVEAKSKRDLVQEEINEIIKEGMK